MGAAPLTLMVRVVPPKSSAPASTGVKLAVSFTAVSAAGPPKVSVPTKLNAEAVDVCIGLFNVTVRPSAEMLLTRVPGKTPVPLTY